MPADTRDEAALEERFAELLAFLEERRSSRQRLSTLIIKPPFDVLREGQAEASATLEETFAVAPITLFEAPTGFGKTGISLSFAFERLRAGLCDRILYLTGKSTGQNEIVRTLRKMIPNEGSLRYLCLRNRIERNAGFEEFDNLSRDELACRWKTADLAPAVLFRGGTIPEEILREEASRIGISPYEIFRACLPFADLLVGDFNYAFHPGSTVLLKGVNDFVPARTLLMADEGHNLPERTASGLSARFSVGDARGATEALGFGHGPKILTRALEDWVEFLEARRKNEVLDADDFYRATDLVETVAEAIRKGPLPRENLAVSELEILWRFEEAARLLEADDLPKRLWAPENGSIEIMCLDAAAYIGTEMRTYGLCLLASATLSPMKEFATACGLQPEEYRSVKGAAPWRSGALRAAIDLRVDTRLVCRYRHLDATATAVLSLIQSSPKPVVVFFPSFRYAGEASAKLREISSLARVVLQPRFGSLGEANEFLAAALSRSDALFLVLGSVFSEGIDSLGGEVDTAMIVGPALPEVNPLQEAKMETLAHMGREEAFRRTYLTPGMRKVNQALGRLARAPEHRARIILHCRRFAQPAYRELIDPVCREAPNLRSTEEMRAWLAAEENTVALPS